MVAVGALASATALEAGRQQHGQRAHQAHGDHFGRPAMLVKNAGTGTGLDIQVGDRQSARSPSQPVAGKATNLDADKLDGQDSTSVSGQDPEPERSEWDPVPCTTGAAALVADGRRLRRSRTSEPNNAIGKRLRFHWRPRRAGRTADVDFYHVATVSADIRGTGLHSQRLPSAGPGLVFDSTRTRCWSRQNLTSRSVSDPYLALNTRNLYHIAVHPSGSPAQPLPYIVNL